MAHVSAELRPTEFRLVRRPEGNFIDLYDETAQATYRIPQYVWHRVTTSLFGTKDGRPCWDNGRWEDLLEHQTEGRDEVTGPWRALTSRRGFDDRP
jgi:hypothetical protein